MRINIIMWTKTHVWAVVYVGAIIQKVFIEMMKEKPKRIWKATNLKLSKHRENVLSVLFGLIFN